MTWYFLLLDGLRGVSTKLPNTAPLLSPTTYRMVSLTFMIVKNEEIGLTDLESE